eukprot:TRINITY_DN17276_c0_g1_i1.p1 TRINITY_DN17276_c0_g1~~TRINITY_DN17276_c0_g1_i1.p1  ORF type:complete len:359 (+),score=62.28 TRINITY_DN17276_c0_g1_i1:41-1117(+)
MTGGCLRQEPFATLMLNGVQCIRCNLPDDFGEVPFAEAEVSDALKEVLVAGGLVLQTVLLSPNVVPKENIKWRGELMVDEVSCIDLGCIRTRRESSSVAEPLPAFPEKLLFRLTCEVIDPTRRITTTSENHLIQKIKEILEDDDVNPRRGALPSRIVEEKAKEHPAYNKVIGVVEPTWAEFIKRHKTIFNVFQYSEQEIKDRKMGAIGMIDEMRIVLRPQERIQLSEQEIKDRKMGAIGMIDEMRIVLRPQERIQLSEQETEVETRLTEYLKELLKGGDLEYHEILIQISCDPEFVFYLAPSFSLLMRFLNRHRDIFSWTTDPGCPTRVSMATPTNQKAPRPRKIKTKPSERPLRSFA